MKRIAYSLSCVLLALAMVLSGPGSAGPAQGVMLVEICAGDSPGHIWIDAEGNPVDPAKTHVMCMDCLLFVASLPEAADGRPILDPPRLQAGLSSSVLVPTQSIAHFRLLPRGPPVAAIEDLRLGGPRPATRSLHLPFRLPIDSHQAASTAKVTDRRAIL